MENLLNRKLKKFGRLLLKNQMLSNGCSLMFNLFNLLTKKWDRMFFFHLKKLARNRDVFGAKKTKLLRCFRGSGQELKSAIKSCCFCARNEISLEISQSFSIIILGVFKVSNKRLLSLSLHRMHCAILLKTVEQIM